MEEVACTINGIPRRIIADSDKSLLRILREDLRLTGTKEGCGSGHCGTCAVLVENQVVFACKYPISKGHGKNITTIEGIGTPSNPHPLQIAFAACGAIQCGFCTPGMIIRAKALLDRNTNPTRRDIVDAIQHHLCRCTGYVKIFEAIETAAAYMRGQTKTLKPSVEASLIGQPVARYDALAKATGTTLFADDFPVDGCAHIKIVRSPHHHAKIIKINKSEALSLTGVLAVLGSDDVKGTNLLKLAGDDQPVLCAGKVRMVGDPVAAVVAVTAKIAREAAKKVNVTYEKMPAVLTVEEALREGAPRVNEKENNLFVQRKIVHGDPEHNVRDAEVVVDGTYSTQAVDHGYLETDTGLAYVNEKGQLVVMSGSQNIYRHRQAIADAVGISADHLRIIQTVTGGAFGGKLDVNVGGILAAAALAVTSPVKLVLNREETFAATSKRHPFYVKGTIGASRDGTLTALDLDALAEGGAYKSYSVPVVTRSGVHASGPYRFPNCRITGRAVFTNTAFKGAMRGFGGPQYAFALESLIDDLAAKLKTDPLELRAKNGFRGGDITITGQKLDDDIGFLQCLERIRPAYSRAIAEARQGSGSRIKRGVGLACAHFASGVPSPDRSEAWAELLPDGRLQVWIGSADVGQGSDTIFWQIAAETMGYPLEGVSICTADTGHVPDGGVSSGSRQTYVSGRAVQKAVAELKRLMKDNGCVTYEDLKKKGIPTIAKIIHQTRTEPIDPADGHGALYETYSFGVQMAEVEVDISTGKVRVIKMTAVSDVGRPINKLNVEGQTQGGIVMGLGYALMEDYRYPETDSFAEFRMPRAKDAPEIEMVFVDSPRKNGPLGACGAGEFAVVPTAPAISNAIYNACGVRIQDLPITADKVKNALMRNSMISL
jgi:aldehyde oxidoreductase